MKKILKIELARAFGSGFLLSLGIGCLISLAHFIFYALPYGLSINDYVNSNQPMMFPGWLFSTWIGGTTGLYTFLFYILIPILAVLPHADSFFTDVKGGFVQNICIRESRKKYYSAKYFATALSGGTAVTFPLILNFILCMTMFPAMKPEIAAATDSIREYSTFPSLYFQHPIFYVLLFLIITFIFSGIYSTISLLSSYYVGYRFMVLVIPLIAYLFLMAIFVILNTQAWMPTNFLVPSYSNEALLPIIFFPVVIGLITYWGFVIKGSKDVY